MRVIESKPYNTDMKQFYCKNCHIGVNKIYKDNQGNTYCGKCKNENN